MTEQGSWNKIIEAYSKPQPVAVVESGEARKYITPLRSQGISGIIDGERIYAQRLSMGESRVVGVTTGPSSKAITSLETALKPIKYGEARRVLDPQALVALDKIQTRRVQFMPDGSIHDLLPQYEIGRDLALNHTITEHALRFNPSTSTYTTAPVREFHIGSNGTITQKDIKGSA